MTEAETVLAAAEPAVKQKPKRRGDLEKNKAYKKLWQQRNKDRLNAMKRAKWKADPERHRAYHKKYVALGGEKVAELRRKNCAKNRSNRVFSPEEIERRRKQVSIWQKKKLLDPVKKAIHNARVAIRQIIKGHIRKDVTAIRVVGCTRASFIAHIESLFSDGMSWENYGQWQIDHKAPCSSFDLGREDHWKLCFHYTNLQPLWAVDNMRKGSTLKTSEH